MELRLRSNYKEQLVATKNSSWEEHTPTDEPTFLIPHRPLWEDIVLATIPNVLTICFQEVVANLKANRRRKMRQELNSHPLAGEILTTDAGHSYLISSNGMLEEVELTESEPEEEDVGLSESVPKKPQYHDNTTNSNDSKRKQRKQQSSSKTKPNTDL